MTISEILLQDFDTEMKGTRTTLERIPEANPEFKCHDKSMPMGRLAVHVATLPKFGSTILTTEVMDLATDKFPSMVFESREKLLADFDASLPRPGATSPQPPTTTSRNTGSSLGAARLSPTLPAPSSTAPCSSTTSSTTEPS